MALLNDKDNSVHTENVLAHDSPTENETDGEDFNWDLNVIKNIAALYFTYFSATWTLSIAQFEIAFINESFPTQTNLTPWISAVINLVSCVFFLFLGEVSDIFGRRWVILGGNILAVVGNIVVSRAENVNTIIGGQVLNGVSTGCTVLVAPMLAEIVPKRSRSVVLGLAVCCLSIVAVLGTLACAAAVEHDVGGRGQGWRLGIYLGTGFAFVAAVLVFFFYHPGKRPNPGNLSVRQRLGKLDWIGLAIGGPGLALFLIGIQFGGSGDGWSSAKVLSVLITGAVLLVIFATWEWKFAEFGLFPRELFAHRNFAIILAIQFIEGIGNNVTAAFINEVSLTFYTDNAITAIIRNFPYGFCSLIGCFAVGYVLYRYREAKWITVIMSALLTISIGLFAVLKPGMNYAAFFFPDALIGTTCAGLGVIIPVVASICTPNRYVGTSISLCNSVRGFGGSVGIIIGFSVFASKLKQELPAKVARDVLEAGLPPTSLVALLEAYASGSPAAYATVPGFTAAVAEALKAGVLSAYVIAFRFLWISLLPFGVVITIAAFFLKSTKAQLTQQVASAVEPAHQHHHHHHLKRKHEDKADEKTVEDIS